MLTGSPSIRRQLLVIACFALLATLLMYMPLFYAETHVPGEGMTDYFHFHWSYWWTRHALTTPGLDLYETNFVMFPHTTNLAYHTYSPFWFPLWALLEPVTGTLIAVQIINLIALTLTGYAMYLLMRGQGISAGLALPGGALLMLSSAMYAAVYQTTIHYLGFFWLPLLLLIWGQVVRHVSQRRIRGRIPGFAWSVGMGVAFYLTVMTDYQYAMYAVFLLLPYGILTLVGAGLLVSSLTRARPGQVSDLPLHVSRKNEVLRLIGAGVLAVAVALILLWFVGPLRPLLAFDRSTLAPGTAEQARAIPFPVGYFWRYTDYREIALGSIILPATILGLIGGFTFLRRVNYPNRMRWFWLVISIPPLLLSAGAAITVAGVEIPLPYALIHAAMGGLFRSVHRFGVVFTIPALVYVGQTWEPVIGSRLRRTPVLGALLLLLVFADARLYTAIPVEPVLPAYDFYAQMGSETGIPSETGTSAETGESYDDYVVLEVPTGAGTGETFIGQNYRDLGTQFYGMVHEKRMVNGLLARAPVENYFSLRDEDELLSWLGQRRGLEPDAVIDQLRERIFEWPIGYIVIHQDFIGREHSANLEITGFFNTLPDLLCPPIVEGAAVVYRTRWHPDGCAGDRTPPEVAPATYRIDIGAAGEERFLGWGWHRPELIAGIPVRWTGDQGFLVYGLTDREPGPHPQADLIVDLPPGDYTLQIEAQSFHEARNVDVMVNGAKVGAVTVTPEALQMAAVEIPAAAIGDGQQITVALVTDGTLSAAEAGLNDDPRPLGLLVNTVTFVRGGE